jgi:hypothetical protein
MAIEVSQHHLQVVATPDQSSEELRVRRFYVEVLVSDVGGGTVHNESANSAISFVSTAAYSGDWSKSASSTINFVQAAIGSKDDQSVNHAISFAHSAVAVRDVPVVAASAITFTSLGGRTLTVNAEHDLSLLSVPIEFNYVADRAPASNVLALVQTVTTLSGLAVDQDLGLEQTLNIVFPIKPVVTQPMGITHHVSTPWRVWVADVLGLSHSARVPLVPQSVTSTMNLTDESPIGRFDDPITFVQTVTYGFSVTAANTMNLTQNLSMIAIWNRVLTHGSFLGHALSWYEDTPCGRKQYTPFQGENTIPSDGTITDPSPSLQDPQGDTGNFSLYIPALGVKTDEVILRNPELDNRDRNAYTRVNNETRGGKLLVYSDPTWPKVRTLVVTIVGLTEANVDELHTFMSETAGQEIGLTDWEGRLWQGFITNPNEAATQDGRAMWTVTFEFEGEMLDVEQPAGEDGQGMNLSHSVTAVIV